MKLLNYSLLLLSTTLFAIVSLWAILFYFQFLNQVKSTIDEGLANYKILIIDQLKSDTLINHKDKFVETNYIIRPIEEDYALKVRDSYKDTLIFSSLKNIHEPARLLTTAFATENGQYYEMKVISQVLDKSKLIKEIFSSLLWLYLFLMFSIIIVNNFILKRTWKPFYQLLKYLKDFRLDKGSLTEPTETRIKEFSELNKTILELLKANIDIYSSQKQFIENASHELQTPMAIGITKLELLAGSKDLSDDHIQKISDIIQTLKRMAGFNKSLLLLSKIENKQFVAEERLDFDEIFNRLIDDFSDYTEYRKIEIKYIKKANWFFKMNKDLAEILVMNLVKNAVIHNRQEGEIKIEMSASHFSIENTSDEPALPADKLFERFNKNPNKKGSTGLGLAIVKAITDSSGLSVTYSYTGKHVIRVSL